jgi:hypothetical protein
MTFVRRLCGVVCTDLITAHNLAGNESYSLGHNAYSHLTLDEFHQRFRLGRPSCTSIRWMSNSLGSASAAPVCGRVLGVLTPRALLFCVVCFFISVPSGKYRYFQSFTEGRSGQRKNHVGEAGLTLRGSALPDRVDWVEAGAVTAGPVPSLIFMAVFTPVFTPNLAWCPHISASVFS